MKKPSRCGKELTKLCNDNSLSISDELLLPSDTFTFVSSSHASTSWLDHVLSTSTGHAVVQSIHVKSDYVTSDHLPLCFTICFGKTIVCPPASVCSTTDEILSFNWTDVTDNDIIKYNVCTKEDLSRIRIPLEALYCNKCFLVLIKQILIIFIMILLIQCKGVLENVSKQENLIDILL